MFKIVVYKPDISPFSSYFSFLLISYRVRPRGELKGVMPEAYSGDWYEEGLQ